MLKYLQRFLGGLGKFEYRYFYLVVLFILIFTGVAIAGLARLTFESDFSEFDPEDIDVVELEKRVNDKLHKNYASGEWFCVKGTQFNTNIMKKEWIRSELNLDIGKKTVVVFPHIFWDATFFWGEDLFPLQIQWQV